MISYLTDRGHPQKQKEHANEDMDSLSSLTSKMKDLARWAVPEDHPVMNYPHHM